MGRDNHSKNGKKLVTRRWLSGAGQAAYGFVHQVDLNFFGCKFGGFYLVTKGFGRGVGRGMWTCLQVPPDDPQSGNNLLLPIASKILKRVKGRPIKLARCAGGKASRQ